jgi:mannose-6-phosphate isomerase-like protein (cupin superfamily)
MFRPLAVVAAVSLGLATQSLGEAPAPALVRDHTDPAHAWGPCPPIFPAGCDVTALQGDPAAGRSDVFLRVQPGVTLARHVHTSAEHMVLVAGELEVEYDGQAAASLRVGSYAYGPARVAHRATCKSAGPCVLFIAFESPIDAIAAP